MDTDIGRATIAEVFPEYIGKERARKMAEVLGVGDWRMLVN
jgi:hypothetical protein